MEGRSTREGEGDDTHLRSTTISVIIARGYWGVQDNRSRTIDFVDGTPSGYGTAFTGVCGKTAI